MRIIFSVFLIAATLLAHAQAQSGKMPETVTTTDGRTIKLNPDGTYSIEPTARTESPLKIERWLFDSQARQYGRKTIRFMPIVRNESGKEVVGFKFTAVFKNAFGDEVFSLNGSSEERLRPKGLSTTKLFYVFEDNQFISNEPYDKLLPLVVGGTAKISVMINAVAFADGTIANMN